MTTRSVSDTELFAEIPAVLGVEYQIPNRKGYGGTGGPGRVLEDLFRVGVNNQDLPDAGRWELKYTSSTSYLTLFHKDPLPRNPSVVHELIRRCGWETDSGQRSFRHTVWGRSARGFKVEVGEDRVSVLNDNHPDIVPHWTKDSLYNSAVTKLRNLILFHGGIRQSGADKWVRFDYAVINHEFSLSRFMRGLEDGWIAIDFDARTERPSDRIRNHGTKFRVKIADCGRLYGESRRIIPTTNW